MSQDGVAERLQYGACMAEDVAMKGKIPSDKSADRVINGISIAIFIAAVCIIALAVNLDLIIGQIVAFGLTIGLIWLIGGIRNYMIRKFDELASRYYEDEALNSKSFWRVYFKRLL